MTNKHLQPKKALRAALFVLLLSVVGMTKGYAYHFSAVCPTGQTLYYNITDAENHYVVLTCPWSIIEYYDMYYYGWTGFTKPVGDIVLAENVQFDGITYSVTAIGDFAFYDCTGLTSIEIPGSVVSIGSAFYGCTGLTSIEIPNLVTSIGDRAFYGCTSLTSIEIPNSVTTIGYSAFGSCTGLTSIEVPNSVTSIDSYAFSGCSGLGQIVVDAGNTVYDSRGNCNAIINTSTNELVFGCKNTVIPNSVTAIGNFAFYGCSGLTSIEIPNSVTSIGSSAFSGCSGLGQIVVDAGNTVYDSRDNCNAIINTSTNELVRGCKNTVIPNSVASIGSSAFSGCSSLTSIEIPNSVTSIGSSAFSGSGLTSIEIPNSVISIADGTFSGCSGLTSIEIPNSVTTIGYSAFSNCTGLTSIEIPSSVTSIGNSAFSGCSGLEQIVVDAGNTVFDSRDNCNAIIYSSLNWLSTGCKNTVIPNTVTAISSYAFYGCTGLTSIEIPNSVTAIYDYAFRDCTGLTSIEIPNSVTFIGGSAFSGCTSLISIEIPDSVIAIQHGAFAGCTSLTSIEIPNSVTAIYDYAFRDCTGLTSVEIPNSVTNIYIGAFCGCTSLTSIEIPNSVESIREGAFYGCTSLTSIEIPNSVFIDKGAFYGCSGMTSVVIGNIRLIFPCAFGDCTNLASITVYAETPPFLMENAFCNVDKSIPVYVPCGLIERYYGDGWYVFENIQEMLPYHLSVTSANDNLGTVQWIQEPECDNPSAIVEAVANEGYAFTSWTENGEVVSTDATYSFTLDSDRNLVANFILAGTHWTAEGSSYADNMSLYGVIQIDGVEQYSEWLEVGAFCGDECRGTAVASEFYLTNRYLVIMTIFGEGGNELTFKLYDHAIGQELDLTLLEAVTFSDEGYGTPVDPYVLNFQHVHSQALAQGWNWWSTYIEQEGINGLEMLESSMGSSGVRIQGRNGTTDHFEYQGNSYWYGSLNAVANEQMYKIRTNAACNAVMFGPEAMPADHPITINGGWNWIGYPCNRSQSINVAMSGFTPEPNDVIKSRTATSTYVSYGSESLWYGTLNTMDPGQGYMYKSNSGETKTLVFQTGRDGGTMAHSEQEEKFFRADASDFADNMVVTAVVELAGEELRSEDYELAAFVGDECRGSVRLMYVEPFDRYIAFLLVSGESAEEMSFVLTDGESMSWSDSNMTFAVDGMAGTATNPVTLRFGTLGVDDNAQHLISIFPNPSNGIYNIEGRGIRKVNVVDAYGQVVLSKEIANDFMQIDLSNKAAGVYMLQVVTDRGITVRKLMKK